MANKKTCDERYAPDGWHFRRCGKPAKFVCVTEYSSEYNGHKNIHGHRCGIHAKRYEKVEKL